MLSGHLSVQRFKMWASLTVYCMPELGIWKEVLFLDSSNYQKTMEQANGWSQMQPKFECACPKYPFLISLPSLHFCRKSIECFTYRGYCSIYCLHVALKIPAEKNLRQKPTSAAESFSELACQVTYSLVPSHGFSNPFLWSWWLQFSTSPSQTKCQLV